MVKLLLVEDHVEIWDFLSRRLERRGYDVVMAHDGLAALETATTLLPALILLDMNLPILDGWAAAGKLKADPRTHNIPIIALTAHALSTDRDRAIEAGCDDYHPKPIDFTALLHQIENNLSKTPAA